MSEGSRPIVYAVFAKVPENQRSQFLNWLEGHHINDVLRLGQGTSAQIMFHEEDPDGFLYEIRYEFPSKASLDVYLEKHAPNLRAKGMKEFPENQYRRVISMIQSKIAPRTQDKAAIYDTLLKQAKETLTPQLPFESRLVSLIALIKQSLSYVSWVGFYEARGRDLWVGPYQGPLACAHIPFGKGVCGYVAEKKIPTIVDDVEKFPGHIACDSLSRSEIVLPVFRQKKFLGVLDLDSYHVSAFDTNDEKYLSELLTLVCD